MERWVELAATFQGEGRQLRIYCAPSEEVTVQAEFARVLMPGGSATLIAGTLEEFLTDAATCSIFAGHDSFGVHAAAALDVPTVLVNGPNIAEVWAPPGTAIVHGDEALRCYPCYGKPTCAPGPERYACIRYIPVEAVRAAICGDATQVTTPEMA
jgi:ADP-heptose:LPS heptosyltransferase